MTAHQSEIETLRGLISDMYGVQAVRIALFATRFPSDKVQAIEAIALQEETTRKQKAREEHDGKYAAAVYGTGDLRPAAP